MDKHIKKDIKRLLMVILSSFIYSLGFKAFIEAGNLFPGGFAGITTLIVRVFDKYWQISIPFGSLYFILNLIPTILVYKYVGKRFTIFSVLQYSFTSIFTSILPSFPVTSDLLLIAVFGGIINGIAIAIALSADASSGGTDFIAIYASTKYRISTWNYVMYFNAAILVIAGILFSWNVALYSIIFQFCSTQIISHNHKRYKLKTLFIVTEYPEEVSQAIFSTCRHGITKIEVEGMYRHQNRNMLIMTVNEFQINSVVHTIIGTDKKAFITINRCDKIIGNYYQIPYE